MAAKKAAAEPVDKLTAEVPESINDPAAEEVSMEAAAAAPTDPWLVNVSMLVPRKPKGEEQSYYVCVNDRRFQVPANGKVQELPKPIAAALTDSLAADAAADEFADKMPNRIGEVPTMHDI